MLVHSPKEPAFWGWVRPQNVDEALFTTNDILLTSKSIDFYSNLFSGSPKSKMSLPKHCFANKLGDLLVHSKRQGIACDFLRMENLVISSTATSIFVPPQP